MKFFSFKFLTFFLISFNLLGILKANGLYYGYHEQVQNPYWEGYFNSCANFFIENNSITYVNPKNYGIVYVTPSNYVILLNYGGLLNEPVPISSGSPFSLSFQEEYYYNGNLVLTAQFNYSGLYYQDHIFGNLDLNVVSFSPQYNIYQGLYHFNFDSGIIIEGNKKYTGYYMQKNNGDWNRFINAPFNITINNNNKITFWNELNKDIVYITSQSMVVKLPFGSQFLVPISVLDGIPFHIEFTNDYLENGAAILTADFIIDGTKTGNYIYGNMSAEITALDPRYNSYRGNFFWDFEAGIEEEILCQYDFKPENQYIPSSGGDYKFYIKTENECFWQITSDFPWISINSQSSGYGNYCGTYSVMQNSDGTPRTATIFLRDENGTNQKIISIKQLNIDCPKLKNSFPLIGYPLGIDVSENYSYISSYGGGLRIVNITNPEAPFEVGFYNGFQYSVDVKVLGNYAYLVDLDYGFIIIDVSNPQSPFFVSRYNPYTTSHDVFILGNYAYLASSNVNGELRIINIADISFPYQVGYFRSAGVSNGIFVSGNLAFLANDEFGLRIIDISNPTNPHQVSLFDTPGYAYNSYVKENLCYLIDGDLRIIDISNPSNPQEIYYYETPGFAYNIEIRNNIAYISDNGNGLIILDVTDPMNPKEIGFYSYSSSLVEAKVSGDYIYAANIDGYMDIYEISCTTDCHIDLGDVNENYSISSFDASLVLQYVVGSIEFSEPQKCKADANANNLVTSLDAAYILQCVIGSCSGLPPELLLSCQIHNNCL